MGAQSPQAAADGRGIAAESPIALKTTHTTRKAANGASWAVLGLTAAFLCGAVSPAAAQSDHILFLDDAPEEQVFELNTRVRHTTVITLPAKETILDFVERQVEGVVLRILPNPEPPHAATADFELVTLQRGQELERVPPDLLPQNPMGIIITYLQADQALGFE